MSVAAFAFGYSSLVPISVGGLVPVVASCVVDSFVLVLLSSFLVRCARAISLAIVPSVGYLFWAASMVASDDGQSTGQDVIPDVLVIGFDAV